MAEAFDPNKVDFSSGEAQATVEPIYTPQVVGEDAPQVPATQRRTTWQTALAVIRPRQWDLVRSNVLGEAKIAADKFYYAIPFTQKDGTVKVVSDGSIGLAYAFVRALGNCAIETFVEHKIAPDGHHIEFTSHFIDLERGVNIVRAITRNIDKARMKMPKLYEKDYQRFIDMNFGAAQSVSQRNAIRALVPDYMWEEAVEEAQKAAAEKAKMEKDAADKALAFIKNTYNVDQDRVEAALGKAKKAWTPDDSVTLRGMIRAIKEEQATVDSIFPVPRPEPPGEPPPEKEKPKKETKKKKTKEEKDEGEGDKTAPGEEAQAKGPEESAGEPPVEPPPPEPPQPEAPKEGVASKLAEAVQIYTDKGYTVADAALYFPIAMSFDEMPPDKVNDFHDFASKVPAKTQPTHPGEPDW